MELSAETHNNLKKMTKKSKKFGKKQEIPPKVTKREKSVKTHFTAQREILSIYFTTGTFNFPYLVFISISTD